MLVCGVRCSVETGESVGACDGRELELERLRRKERAASRVSPMAWVAALIKELTEARLACRMPRLGECEGDDEVDELPFQTSISIHRQPRLRA